MAKRKIKPNILIIEPDRYSPKAVARYKSIGNVFVTRNFRKLLPEADILVARLFHIDKKIIDKAKRLKIIAVNTTGLNHIDLREAKKRKIEIVSLGGKTDFLDKIYATAELTFGLIISLIRKIPASHSAVVGGTWNRYDFAGNELNGKTLGIVGLGRLGKKVAKYARTFGMSVIAYDPNVSRKEMKKIGVSKITLEGVFKKSDVVSIHALHNSTSNRLIKRKHFKLMKPTAFLVNTARGEIVDEAALLGALNKKQIAGAALDVLVNENLIEDFSKHPLIKYARKNQNLIITPHTGGAAIEAWQKTEEYLAEQVLKYFRNHENRFK
jgi:D-3-phosphoglycerate dehydrogenase